MQTDSVHLILDLWMSENWSYSWVKKIEEIIDREFSVVKKIRHDFEPHGETVAYILSESHFTLHSYPEENYISLDIYICKPNYSFVNLVSEIEEFLPISKINNRTMKRGEYALPLLTRWKNAELVLLVTTFIVAACSLLYELLLAQNLSTVLGDSAHRYNVTIGLYIASMGLGALLYNKFNFQDKIKSLFKVEILLIVFGGLSPIAAIILDSILRDHYILLSVFLHLLIIIIGVLSGFELPLLMDIGKKKRERLATIVLGVDYVGTLFAAILFPLLLVPLFSIFGIAAIVAGLNSLVAISFIRLISFKNNKEKTLYYLVSAMCIFFAWYGITNEEKISEYLISRYFLGAR